MPFIIQFPRWMNMRQGQVRDQPIELRDIMPTILDAAGVEIPDSVDGNSLLPLCRDLKAPWREFVQGEHTVSYGMEWGNQWVTNGKEKYIWFHHTGKELFFDLREDPQECHDLSKDPAAEPHIAVWRKRLAEINARRGDPRGQGGKLVPQPNGAISLSPYYEKWKQRAEEMSV